MNKLQAVLKWMDGKKSHIGSLLLSLLGAVLSLDYLVDGQANWMSPGAYAGIGMVVGGLTGVSMRMAVGKATTLADILGELMRSVPQNLEQQYQQKNRSDVNTAVEQLKAAGDK